MITSIAGAWLSFAHPAIAVDFKLLMALAARMPVIDVLPIGACAAACRAATNLTSNIIATFVIGRRAGAVDPKLATAITAEDAAGSFDCIGVMIR